MKGFVNALWVQNETNCQKDVHLISLLVDLVVLIRLSLKDYYKHNSIVFYMSIPHFNRTLDIKMLSYIPHLKHSFCPLDINKNVGECPDCVVVSSHHHVSKTDIVVHSYLTTGDTRIKTTFLVQLDTF